MRCLRKPCNAQGAGPRLMRTASSSPAPTRSRSSSRAHAECSTNEDLPLDKQGARSIAYQRYRSGGRGMRRSGKALRVVPGGRCPNRFRQHCQAAQAVDIRLHAVTLTGDSRLHESSDSRSTVRGVVKSGDRLLVACYENGFDSGTSGEWLYGYDVKNYRLGFVSGRAASAGSPFELVNCADPQKSRLGKDWCRSLRRWPWRLREPGGSDSGCARTACTVRHRPPC